MANPYLSSDESVILATDRVSFRAAPLSAVVLTNKRLLLIRADGDSLTADEILLSKLRTVNAAAKEAREPAVLLTHISEGGEIRQETLAFTEAGGISRAGECGEWVGKLREQIVPSPDEGSITRIPPPAKAPARPMEEKPAEPASSPPPVTTGQPADRQMAKAPLSPPGGILAKHDRPSGLSFPAIPSFSEPDLPEPSPPAPSPPNRYTRIAAIALVILAVCAILFLASQFLLPARPGSLPAPAPAVPVTTAIPTNVAPPPTAVTTLPVTTAAADASQTDTTVMAGPSPPPSATPAPQLPIPDKGVWLAVQYAGKYTGSIEVGGGRTPVEGTGDHLFQIVMKTGIAKASVRKTEGSSDRLTAAIYRDGQLVVRDSTTIPRGELSIQADIKAQAPAPTIVANTTL